MFTKVSRNVRRHRHPSLLLSSACAHPRPNIARAVYESFAKEGSAHKGARARKRAMIERAQAAHPRTPVWRAGPGTARCDPTCEFRWGGRCGRFQAPNNIIIAKRCENRKMRPDSINSHTGRASQIAGRPQKLRPGPQNLRPDAGKHCFFTGMARCGRPPKNKWAAGPGPTV